MANVLSAEKRLAVLAALVDGNSIRAAERMTDVHRDTVMRFGVRLGEGAQHLHNALARDLTCPLIECDELWSYVRKKQARVTDEENAAGLGEAYTFVALAMPSRFVITWKVGKRDELTTDAFLADLRARLIVMPAMTSDGFAPYVPAIGKHLGLGVDYVQVIKNYGARGHRDDDHRYEPPRDLFITKMVISGAPNVGAATTSHVERHNGTMRHLIGRMRRLVYAFSKKPEHHRAAISLAYTYYNLCWIPRDQGVTPAVTEGVVDHVYDLREFMDAVLSAEPCVPPARQPLAQRRPEGPARELPNGRGFLRLVSPGEARSAPSSAPAVPPAAPPQDAPAPSIIPTAPSPMTAPVDDRQLDLFAWKPRATSVARPLPPVGTQLSLFDELASLPRKLS